MEKQYQVSRELVRERNDSCYEQFEISPETVEQELRPAVCESDRQTDLRSIIIYRVDDDNEV